jgi:hypothetical protein
MEPFLAKFSQLFEGALGQDLDTLLSERIDLSLMSKEAEEQDRGKEFKK